MTDNVVKPWRAENRTDLIRRYGTIERIPSSMPGGEFEWRGAEHWLKPCYIQEEITKVLKNAVTGHQVEAIYCNIDMHKPLLDVFDDLIAQNLHAELETFDGCFVMRYVRGVPGIMSIHSWGLALDFNALENPLCGESSWAPAFVDVWKKHGFTWGGDFSRPDPMHWQWAAKF